jgi:glutamate-1-semialdehyde aminotransferase
MRIRGIPIPLVVNCQLRDVEGNELIDMNMGFGPHLFGYADREVVDAIADQFFRGHMTGIPHELESEAGLHPNPLEPWFLSTAHSKNDIDQAVDIIQQALSELS